LRNEAKQAQSCQNGGGVAVLLLEQKWGRRRRLAKNNDNTQQNNNSRGNIPVAIVNRQDANRILNRIGQFASISLSDGYMFLDGTVSGIACALYSCFQLHSCNEQVLTRRY